MPDKGGFVHHMIHSVETTFDPDGIFYNHAFTKLRTDLSQAKFYFPSICTFQLYVKPMLPPGTPPAEQIIFSKRTDTGIFFELRMKSDMSLMIKANAGQTVFPGFFTYGKWTRIGLTRNGFVYKVYNNLTRDTSATMVISMSDDLNYVFLLPSLPDKFSRIEDVPGG